MRMSASTESTDPRPLEEVWDAFIAIINEKQSGTGEGHIE